ncbi:hypothetical protein NHQ30_004409 [Ciborinia camelliae]|nr:hypothetical protein NHQ30_004409 [Ciborinia camelliae]
MNHINVNLHEVVRELWEGPADDDPIVVKNRRPLENAFIQLSQLNKTLTKENTDLKRLLEAHNISWPAKNGSNTITTSKTLAAGLSKEFPNELQLHILGLALQLAHPIIDPGVKILKSNVTESEHAEQQNFPVQLLLVSKLFNEEGKKIMFCKNKLVFTQASSLKWLVKTCPEICATLEHLELRIIGKYYDDHRGPIESFPETTLYKTEGQIWMKALSRVPSLNLNWTGPQSYCWRQVCDFLQALQLPTNPRRNPRSIPRSRKEKTAFKNLKSMIIDLANFMEDLPAPGIGLRTLTRESLCSIVDEIYVRGLVEGVSNSLAYECLGYLVRDGGLKGYVEEPPFTSNVDGEYLITTNTPEHEEDLHVFLYNHDRFTERSEPEENERQSKYVTKELSKTFGQYEGDKVKFHTFSGYPVWTEGTMRVLVDDQTEEELDATKVESLLESLDENLDGDFLERIYGPAQVNGGGVTLGEDWNNFHGDPTPDARICYNCTDTYGYFLDDNDRYEMGGRMFENNSPQG